MTESPNPHRNDSPSPNISCPVSLRRQVERARVAVAAGPQPFELRPSELPGSEAEDFARAADREAWLGLQASDLIGRLQVWADELDAREARLNVQASLQDSRERQFRLRQQDSLADLAEQRRSIERLRIEMEAQARRLAFRDN